MKVKFVPLNQEYEIKPGQSVLDVANEHSIYIKSVCRGVPSCAECRVKVTEGEFNVFPPMSKELALIGTAYFVDQRRLSCQLKCFGDITIDLTEQVEKEDQVVKRPRGGREVQNSQAITGNIIFEPGESAKAENYSASKNNQNTEKMRREDQKRKHAEELYEKEQRRQALERIKRQKSGHKEED